MKHWKDIAFGLFVSLTLAACYGEEDSFATPDIYKDYQPVLKDGNTVARICGCSSQRGEI